MQKIIVSRHPAAVEFIHRELPEFADAPVIEAATPDDVRGAEVAGNLPLHLAALCRVVHAVEFSGAPPRGAEYTLADMIAAGAHIASYVVAALPPLPAGRTITFDDRRRPRGYYDILVVGRGDAIHRFTGEHIPGIVAVVGAVHHRAGKWSGTVWELHLAPGAWFYGATVEA